jgi:hypothetical protein
MPQTQRALSLAGRGIEQWTAGKQALMTASVVFTSVLSL